MIDTLMPVLKYVIDWLQESRYVHSRDLSRCKDILGLTRSVAEDYITLLQEVESRIEQETESVVPIIRWLEERRAQRLAIRIELRAFADDLTEDQRSRLEDSKDAFIRGIWGVLKGGYLVTEATRIEAPNYSYPNNHTLLDLMFLLSRGNLAEHKTDYLNAARRQRAAIEDSWREVVDSYARMQRRVP